VCVTFFAALQDRFGGIQLTHYGPESISVITPCRSHFLPPLLCGKYLNWKGPVSPLKLDLPAEFAVVVRVQLDLSCGARRIIIVVASWCGRGLKRNPKEGLYNKGLGWGLVSQAL